MISEENLKDLWLVDKPIKVLKDIRSAKKRLPNNSELLSLYERAEEILYLRINPDKTFKNYNV